MKGRKRCQRYIRLR